MPPVTLADMKGLLEAFAKGSGVAPRHLATPMQRPFQFAQFTDLAPSNSVSTCGAMPTR